MLGRHGATKGGSKVLVVSAVARPKCRTTGCLASDGNRRGGRAPAKEGAAKLLPSWDGGVLQGAQDVLKGPGGQGEVGAQVRVFLEERRGDNVMQAPKAVAPYTAHGGP